MSAPSSSSSSLSPSTWPPPAAPPPPSLQQPSYILMSPPSAPLTASTGTVLVEATSGVQHELPQRYHHHRPVHQQQASGTSSLACLLAAAGSVGVAGTVVLQPSHRLAGAGSACVSGTASGSAESLSSPPAAPTRPSRPSPRLVPLPPPFQHVLQEHNYGAPPPCSPTPPPAPTPPASVVVTCPPQSQTSPFSAGPAYVSPSTPASTGSPSRLAFVHRIPPSPSSHAILQSSSAAAVAAAIAALGPPPQPAIASPVLLVAPSISSSTGGSNSSEQPPPGQLMSLVDDVGLVATVAASGGRAGARLAGSPPSPPPVPIGPGCGHDGNGLIGVDPTADSDAGSSANDAVGSLDDSVTRCICDFEHDDGYMICCDRCSAWQHVDCMGLDRGSMPDDFLCHVCEPATLRRLDRRRARAIQLRKRQRLARQHTQQQRRRQQLQKAGRRQLVDAGDSTAEAAAGKRQRPASDGQLAAGGGAAVQRKRTATAATSSLNKTTASATVVVKKRRMTRESGPRSSTESLKDSAVAPVLNSDPDVVLPPPVPSATSSPRDYEPAITNHYSPELRARLASMRTGAVPPPPAAGCEPCVVAPVAAEAATSAGDAAAVGGVEYCLLASAPLPANTTLVEFRGKCGLADQFRQQHPLLWKRFQPHVLYYKFPRDQLHVCVDARSFGNVARYVRRSCRPNAVVRHVVDKGSLHLYLVASCPIARTAELTIAHEQTGARQMRCACRPGAVECRVREVEQTAAAPLSGPAGYQLGSAASAQHHHVPALARRSNGSITGGRPAALSSGTPTTPVRKRSAFHPAVSITPASSSVSVDQLSGRDDSTNNNVSNSNHRRPSSASSGSSTSTASSGSSSDSSSTDDDDRSSSSAGGPAENDPDAAAAQKESRGEARPSGQRPRQQRRQRARSQLRRQKDEVATSAGAKKKQSPVRAAPAAEKSSPVDDTPPQSADKPRKLTREERKLEAIMKAFERMEKQQQRNQQQPGTGGESPRKGHRSGGAVGGSSPRPSSVEDSTTANSTPLSSTPASAGSLTGRKRSLSRRGGSAAARSRIMSPRRRKSSGPTLPGATPTAGDGTAEDGRQPTTAPVQTTGGAAGVGGTTPLSAPAGGHMASQGFRFPRTKKVLMSEWLKETVETVMVRSPCRGDAGTDEPGGADGVPAMYTRGARSPPHACRRASLSVVGSDPPPVSLGLTAGSAKKRWLRQAIIEEAEPAAAVTSTGAAGLLNGAANSSSPASRPESPGAFDHITPLKKRLLRDSSAALMSTSSLPPPPAPVPSSNPLSSPILPANPLCLPPLSSNPLSSPSHSANPLSSPPLSSNPLSSPPLSSNPLSSPSHSANPLFSPPLPVFCAPAFPSDQPLNLSSPLHHRGDDDSSRCSEPLWIASARPLDAHPPEPVKSEWSAPPSVKSEALDALSAARDSIAFGCKQLSNDDDVIKREPFAGGGLAHSDPPLFACYMNSRSSLVDRLVTARYGTDGYDSVKYRPDGQTPSLDRRSPTAVDGDLVKFRRTGDGFPDAANRQWTAMNCAVSPLKFDDQNWQQRSPMAVNCRTGAGGDGPVVNSYSRLEATLLVKKEEEELESVKSDPLDLLTASPTKLSRVFSASTAVVGDAPLGSQQVLQDKPRLPPDEEDGEQLLQQRQQAVIKRRLSLQDYRRRKKDPAPPPPEPPLRQLAASSEMLPAATAATSSTTSSTLSLTTVSTSQAAASVEATTRLSSATDRSRSTAPLGIDPDDSDSSVTSDSSPLKCSAAGSVLTDVRWSAEPTALERQRETLTARLRRNFGIGIEQQQATLTPPARPPSPPPERPPSPSSPPPERPPSPASPLPERPPSPASSPPERPPSPTSPPPDASPIGEPTESPSSDGMSSAGSSNPPPGDSFGDSSSSPSPPPPPASPVYFGRRDAPPPTGSLSPPPPPPTPPRLLDPPPSPPPSRPQDPPSPPPPRVVQAPSSPSPPSVPPPQLRVPPPQHPPFPPPPISLQQRLPPPPFGRQARRSPPPPPFPPSVVRPLRLPPTWRIRSPFAPGSRHALPNGLPTCPPPPPRPRPVRLPPPSAQLLKPPPALPPRRPPPSPS